ncbi:DALR anticodon-binding domain-containing protein 3 [Topomyia yanbarensis]|uniref:DALR anticodon-binding domain-containing protein 3 n=1 Tax=Topomyia yanbarensis TaxID=2498891 RepID=UPI00273ABB1C|nr:DALR anticodon-binding domain-containing protein 3 [Topomyia yanbarensis]
MDILSKFEQQVTTYLQGYLKRYVIKYQNKRLAETGDIVVKQAESRDVDAVELDALIGESKEWAISITKAQATKIAISLYLNREAVYRTFILQYANRNFACAVRTNDRICLICDVDEKRENLSMVDFRRLAVKTVADSLLRLGGYNVSNELNDSAQTMIITDKRSKQSSNNLEILCGSVTTYGITATEYISKRANDMQLIAQHKYGIRVKDHRQFQQTIASLGRSAAIVDMLESKVSSPIDMKKQKNQSSKGASFILYNYARLSVLFNTYNEKQNANYYPQLPPISKIDFTLLIEEDEWQLFWVYVAGFPAMVKQALGDGQLMRFAPHVVLSFTSGLVICLSKYYRRVRILTENREHLLSTMFARIHLLQSVYTVLSTLLKLLNLEPVTKM